MRNPRFTRAAAFSFAALAAVVLAVSKSAAFEHDPPLGNNPHPVIWGGQQRKPASSVARKHTRRPAGHVHHRRPHHGSSRSYYRSGLRYPYAFRVYRYDPYYGYPGFYVYPPLYYAYPPPLWLSAEALYGPQAVRRFMGAGTLSQPRANINVIGPPAVENVGIDAPQRNERATNARANARAWKFIGYGDAQFAKQEFVEANQRYRKAAHSAPQLADARFRQGFALSASGRYDLAVGAMKRGLRLDPHWARSDFDLDELYGGDQLAKNAQLDALAKASQEKPHDANLSFLAGVHYHSDGQKERAKDFFRRAEGLVGGDSEHIQAFLDKGP